MNTLILGMAMQAFFTAILSHTGLITLCVGQQYICALILLIVAFVTGKFNL